MKKLLLLLVVLFSIALFPPDADAQCSICTRTAEQLGEKPAKGLNAGIVYLAAVPFALVGIIGYRWWKNNKAAE